MQTLTVTSEMRAPIGGAFYPTGFSMVMYPTQQQALDAAECMTRKHFTQEDIFLVPPAVTLSEIAPTADDSNGPLPSYGTDGSTVRTFRKLADAGYFGLLVRTPQAEDKLHLRDAIRGTAYALAQRYSTLVIEDL